MHLPWSVTFSTYPTSLNLGSRIRLDWNLLGCVDNFFFGRTGSRTLLFLTQGYQSSRLPPVPDAALKVQQECCARLGLTNDIPLGGFLTPVLQKGCHRSHLKQDSTMRFTLTVTVAFLLCGIQVAQAAPGTARDLVSRDEPPVCSRLLAACMSKCQTPYATLCSPDACETYCHFHSDEQVPRRNGIVVFFGGCEE
ncbi:hypothetical protein Moror_9228 [Moniliophthora roreri MCA 2997]|uniref:Uncharacterized protein n=1 Tax=Moniliophthora roreri (strain MCA 2997) TaxID=1381753 RepID=V2WWM5_MONRO|nr:hypothetical protein Moror_9228 [Moniliophthora roreri MCA 2997]